MPRPGLLAATLAVTLSAALAAAPPPATAQPRAEARAEQPARSATQPPALPGKSVTHHSVALPGRTLAFTATVGAQRGIDAQGAPEFDVVTTAFALDGAEARTRPVTFVFNGGPGAASAFLDLGLAGPWRLPLDGAALAPSAPPVVAPNEETWLDFTDLVFIDPVGTGFSRFVSPAEELRKRVWSVEGDVDVLAGTIRRWLAQNGRATSPKFILGESYGGFRGPRVVRALQTGQGIGVEGLIMVSPLLDYGGRSGAFDPLALATHLPSMAAAARERNGPVDRAALADVEAYAAGDLVADLMRGLQDHAAVARVETKVAAFTGLDRALVDERDGRVDSATFLRGLHRDDGTVGSFYEASALSPDPFPEFAFSNHSDLVYDGMRAPLTSAMLDLYGGVLKWLPDAPYEISNGRVNRDWELGRGGRPESASALRQALALDRRLRVLIGHGTTDLVTPYFATQLILNQMPPGLDTDRVRLAVFPGGHMFYTRDASRRAFRDAARALYPGE